MNTPLGHGLSRPVELAHLIASALLAAVVAPLAALAALAAAEAPVHSAWVYPGPNGALVYHTTPAGDRIMDFSQAGYMGGGVALPDVAVKRTVQPSGGGADDTERIQAAIDEVAALAPENGFRGAVLLAPGTFTCSGTLVLSTSGVVLRGSGSDPASGGTTIKMTGPRHRAIVIGQPPRNGRRAARDEEEENAPAANDAIPRIPDRPAETTIADAYVPAGVKSFTVADAAGFSVGDTIEIRRPTTAAWIKLMGMDTLVRDGQRQTWIGESRSGVSERTITAIDGRTFTVDLSLADSYDGRLLNPPGVAIVKVAPAPTVSHVGVEALHLQCPPLEVSYGQAPYSAIRVGGDDCWVRDLYCEELMNATVLAGRRITLQRVVITHTYPNLGASKPADFSIEGSQILIDRCEVTGDNEYFVWTASLHPGPNVVLNSVFRGRGSRIQPHMRWSTGLLVDNCTVPDGGIDFPNRGVAGSGHGWTMGWGVAWNSIAAFYVIQHPPGAANWAIGCVGERVRTARYFDTGPILPEGIFDAHGAPVAPQSLYLAQLEERLGRQALRNLGYEENSAAMFPRRNTPRLPALPSESDPELGVDLALHRPVNTSQVRNRSREFGGERALDANGATYWSINDGVTRAMLEVDTEGPLVINAVAVEEAGDFAGRVRSYRIEGQVDSDWLLLAQGESIGERIVHRFPDATVWKVRLTILDATEAPAIRRFSLYRAASAEAGGR